MRYLCTRILRHKQKSKDKLNNRTKIFILFIALGLTSALGYAQVTIGSSIKPLEGVLLDLKETDALGANSSKGLLLPRVQLKKIESLELGEPSLQLDAEKHIGLMLYNTYKYDVTTIPPTKPIRPQELICPGVHVWDGESWDAAIPYRNKGSIRCDGKVPTEPEPIDPEQPDEIIGRN